MEGAPSLVGWWSTDLPPLTGIVRDPNDDMILACAVAAGASHVVTRDNDLLALGVYEKGSRWASRAETFLGMLRSVEYE